MKRHYWIIGMLLALVFGSGVLRAMPGAPEEQHGPAVAGEYLVKFKPNTRVAQREAAVQALGGHLVDRIGPLDVDLVRFGTGNLQAAADIAGALEASPVVDYIQPNYVYTVAQDTTRATFLPLVLDLSSFLPNDPALRFQYAWTNLNAFKGWVYDQGRDTVVVAIVDTGVQLNHPDLQSKLLPGYDFVDDDEIADDAVHGHGTHVAGIVGAETNNGIGVAGTCPQCKLLPVRVLNNSGGGSSRDVAMGIVYAADQGAQVINLSLGGMFEDETLEAAVEYAWSRGTFVACAAGNDGDNGNPINFPAYYETCEAVGATNQDDSHALYSEYGTWVDIVAPGTSIYSTYKFGGYATIGGTSMATPFVSGVAGILAGQGLSNEQIRERLRLTADPIAGTDVYWSNGRLNLFSAVRPQ